MSQATQSIAVLPGDGIGEEVTRAALEVIRNRAQRHSLSLKLSEYPVGGKALEVCGEPLPKEVLRGCLECDALLLGAVGDPRYDANPPHLRPESAILGLRRELGLFANLRPVTPLEVLLESSPLRAERVRGVDILFVRELTGGIYFGEPRGTDWRRGERTAFDTEIYSESEISRIARVAFQAARIRSFRVSSVDKANVLESSRLWRQVVSEVAVDFPDIKLEHILVDNCAMQLIRDPRRFDVLLTSNLFGDILSDEASVLAGSLGMLPSASLGQKEDGRPSALFEPIHGSAPDIAGQGTANPLAAILSAALMFRHAFQRDDIAREIESAVSGALHQGARTADIATEETSPVGTDEMLRLVLQALR